MKQKKYPQLREHLIKIGIDLEIVEHLDTLKPSMQEDIAMLFTEMATDELLFVLSLKDFAFSKNYIESRKHAGLLQ